MEDVVKKSGQMVVLLESVGCVANFRSRLTVGDTCETQRIGTTAIFSLP